MNNLGSMPRIETERLLLRPFCLYDVKTYYGLATDEEVLKGTDMPHELDEASAREWVVAHPESWQRRKELFVLVTTLDTREIVGSVSVFTYDRHDKADLGYWIARSEWGKGYATEATEAIVKYVFGTMKLHKLEANHLARNPSSGKVLEKLGFIYEGLHRDAYLKDGVHEDLVFYGLLRDEYMKARGLEDEPEEEETVVEEEEKG